MNLLKPLELEETKTEDLSMVPTKGFFKPVLVMVAPLSKDNAALLKCEYLYDAAGNPQHFEGAHRLEGELSGAFIRLIGKTIAPVELKTEKVAHFSLFRLEKGRGMNVKMRAHLPEVGERELLTLFRFLATLNKEGYTLHVMDAQPVLEGTLPTGKGKDDPEHRWPEPGEGGFYDLKTAAKRPFRNQKPKLIADIITLQVEDNQYVFGYTIEAYLKAGAYTFGVKPNVRDTVYASSPAAASAAARLLWQAQAGFVAAPTETKAVQHLRDFLVDIEPQLKAVADAQVS